MRDSTAEQVPPPYVAACVQAAPVAFDLQRTLEKVRDLAADAARGGAKLILFPEAFVSAYPRGADFGTVIGLRSDEGRELFRRYHASSIDIPGPAVEYLGRIAKQNRAHLVIGVIERDGGTLYCTVLFFAADGQYLGKHRKLMPTGAERLVWGFGDGSTLPVYNTDIGRLGAVICWENYMPMMRTAMYAQRIQVYCAPTADGRPTWASSMQHIALEGRCFVISSNQFCRRSDYPADYPSELPPAPEAIVSRGGSCIVDPLGKILAGPLWDREDILTAEIDLRVVTRGLYDFDPVGHYSRPDIFSLTVDKRPKEPVRAIGPAVVTNRQLRMSDRMRSMNDFRERPHIVPGKPVRWFPLRPHHLVDDITPTSHVFILAPLGIPVIDVADWRLEIAGLIERPITLSFDDILRFPKQELQAFHECAGDPRQSTLATRRINNVVWSGVSLLHVFSRYGVAIQPQASFLWAGGLDRGLYGDTPVDSYVKDLPLDEALAHAFLAYELNGAPLMPEYGYPLRLVMPGYYGTNSVKWLCRLELAETRSKSLFTTELYNDPVPPEDPLFAQGGRPVWRVAPESVIVAPALNETVSGATEIWGWTWAHATVRKVEVSVDEGETWHAAELDAPTQRSWQKFKFLWRPEKVGPTVLMSRATDGSGGTQPMDGARNCIYAVNVVVAAPG